MKYYKVTYYTGRSREFLYVEAKSINEALRHGKEQLQADRKIGCVIRRAERVTAAEYNGLLNRSTYGASKRDAIKDPKVIAWLIKEKGL